MPITPASEPAIATSPSDLLGDPLLARVYGLPFTELPRDLYIPPDALAVMLDAFEGPLDLLLYLIRKANINILDIPMAALTTQYLTYVEAMQGANLELAAEYLLMAAMLIEIKSRMLLPRQRPANDTEDAADPRAELVRRLIEYEQMKGAALRLDTHPVAGRDFQWADIALADDIPPPLPEVSIEDLRQAWLGILKQAKWREHHHIQREELSVREHMSLILRYLQAEEGFVAFTDIFAPELGIPVLVVHFLALLELTREGLVELVQNEAFAPIYLRQRNHRDRSEYTDDTNDTDDTEKTDPQTDPFDS